MSKWSKRLRFIVDRPDDVAAIQSFARKNRCRVLARQIVSGDDDTKLITCYGSRARRDCLNALLYLELDGLPPHIVPL